MRNECVRKGSLAYKKKKNNDMVVAAMTTQNLGMLSNGIYRFENLFVIAARLPATVVNSQHLALLLGLPPPRQKYEVGTKYPKDFQFGRTAASRRVVCLHIAPA